MKRIIVLVGVVVLSGCGSNQTLTPAGACIPAPPVIEARRTSDRIRIEYKVAGDPLGCEAVAIHVHANSVDKLDNIAPRPTGTGPIRLTDDEGAVELKLPPLDLPPYEAKASTVSSSGRRSDTVTVGIPETGDYCRRARSAVVCIRLAQAKFMRCLRGKAARSECPDYVWNARPFIPYVPLRGVTRARLERSFAVVASGGSAEFVSVRCRALRRCVATWRLQWGTLRARYDVSSFGSRAGCWVAERRAILAEDPPPKGFAPLRHVVGDRFSGCGWFR